MEDLVTVLRTAAIPWNVAGMRALVTGHTGFKGSWLVEWLLQRGAKVTGIALPPEQQQGPFTLLRHEERIEHVVCDIRDAAALSRAIQCADPEVVFHLAAQALVLRSYEQPLLTWETNVSGTLNVLEALRGLGRAVTAIVVTTDKVYRNREWEYAYREEDELGGHDPYSASKAGCEIGVASWRASFGARAGVTVVTARAGNVLGAGDFSPHRIVPDCFRAWNEGETVRLRHPTATRPWQHVLEPLSGYLSLAGHARSAPDPIAACNFGPGLDGVRTVEELVCALAHGESARRWESAQGVSAHEAHALALSIERARFRLGWSPTLSFEETVAWTEEGYTAPPDRMPALIERQIAEFDARARLRMDVAVPK
jgi:CDP-glucose 4,6-dehydratase